MADNPQIFDIPIGNVVGPKGDTGNGISSIELLQTVGLNKTYRITMTDETYFDFVVTDGNGISGVSFNPETYTLTLVFDNGTSYTTGSLRGAPGQKGDDGYSPTITVANITGGHRVTITDKNGIQTVDVMDGTNGTDGYSPAVTVTDITGGHRVTITDADHPTGQSFDVMDGASDAGQVAYDETEDYPDGSIGAEVSQQKNATSYIEDVIVGGRKIIEYANISASGAIEGTLARKLTCFRIQPGTKITVTGTFDLCGFFVDEPEMGSISYNGSRTITDTINNVTVPDNCKWIAVRSIPENDLTITPDSYAFDKIEKDIKSLAESDIYIDWEQGRISLEGEDVPSTYAIRSKNFIPVTENDKFYVDIPLTGSFGTYFYSSDGTFLYAEGALLSRIVVPTNAASMRIDFRYGVSHDITVSEAKKLHFYRDESNIGEIIKALGGEYYITDWTENTQYLVGKVVRNDGHEYICKTEHTSTSSFDESKFSPTNISRRVDILKPRIQIEYARATRDETSPAGTIYYNITLNSIQLIRFINDGNTFSPEAIPYYKEAIYVYEGHELKWDDVKCEFVSVNPNDVCEIRKIPVYSKIGYGIKATGEIVSIPSYNISVIEMNAGDSIVFRGYVPPTYAVLSETDAAESYYKPIIIGDTRTGSYLFTAEKHMFVACTCHIDDANYDLFTKASISTTITPEWEMLGYFNRYGAIQSISQSVPGYSISKPVKLYAGDKITMTCWAVANDPALIEYQDRWNTYWANALGNANVLIMPTATGTGTYECIVPKTAYYVFSCNVTDETIPEITVERTQDSTAEIDILVFNDEANYGLDQHNYVDKYDYVPDLVAKRANAILTYSADDKKSNNYMVNAVAYPNGEIIACRAGGQVVKIANDGTETVLLTIANAQDWRGMFMDSKLNVYVSPHSSTFSPGISATDRGLYRLAYGATSFTKVISLCRSTTEITEWKTNTSYAVGDKIIRDNQSDAYICKTAHTSSDTFDSLYWIAVANWAQSTSYSVGDLCRYNSCYFRCISDHVSGTRFDVTKWNAATEYMDNDDTIWTMCEDGKGYLYAGVYSHAIRANPAVYRSTDDGNYFFYQHNFIMNGTLPESTYGFNAVRHVHCINYNPYDDCLYAAVGEVNTIVKSSNKGVTWQDLHVACYYGQPTYVLGVKDGLVIGSDGHYSCGVSKLMTDGKTIKLCGRTAPGFIFNIRRSDLTGWLYAWTRIDNIVSNINQCPPPEAIDDIDAYNAWVATAPASTLRFWNPYHEWAEKYYPEDARRPQNSVIMVSKDEGETWEVINKVKVSQNNASICGYITVGYFRDGECLAGLLKPIDNTESGKAFVQPVVISEGKKKRIVSGYDLSGEIFIKTNTSTTVSYE